MMNKAKKLLIIGVLVLIVVLVWQNKVKQERIEKLTEECSFEKGDMADNIKSQAIIEKDRIVYKERINRSSREINKGNSKKEGSRGSDESVLKTSVRYMPPEAKAEISVDLEGNVRLKIKNKGFCLCPAISWTVNKKGLKGGIEARVAYWGRYGLGLGINVGCSGNNNNYNTVKQLELSFLGLSPLGLSPFLSVERRISDIIPFMRNTTVGIVYDGDLGVSLSLTF